ncbi:hypothetical protein [Streptosporangium nondiastaticum]|nr:hypothetical protein [Streptosporangium nondiastaticum]
MTDKLTQEDPHPSEIAATGQHREDARQAAGHGIRLWRGTGRRLIG